MLEKISGTLSVTILKSGEDKHWPKISWQNSGSKLKKSNQSKQWQGNLLRHCPQSINLSVFWTISSSIDLRNSVITKIKPPKSSVTDLSYSHQEVASLKAGSYIKHNTSEDEKLSALQRSRYQKRIHVQTDFI